ncbi:hypothetical protein B9Z55_016285 [Caenorhabditis nigoni]|uniref:DNA helicase Pif1-like 2B domain-containing protein n=1 Tax=Caenorhabditis nigoni TaxID=1611254 RepID=A0A2G5UDY5_9PELO|nr:hypothetical protein B9Z55_016285 [Caenorhabditis nigoni]
MKKKRLLIAPAVFKLKKLKSESAEEYSVRKLGLRKYHYKRDGEDDALFETMESLLPRIHSEFIKSDTTLTVNNLSLSEVDDLTMVPINDDEEAAVKKLADKIKKKTTMIRLCDHQCPLSNGKVFLAAENHIMKMKSFTDAYTFAQHLVSSNSENMENTDMHFSKFLTMYHGCYSGIRSIETKYKSCLNISTELIKIISIPSKVIRKKKASVPRVYWPTVSEGDIIAMEDFYRRLVMMFMSWRNESTILSEDETYEMKWFNFYSNLKENHAPAFHDIQKFISGLKFNAKRYADIAEEKSKRQQLLEELEVNVDITEEDILKMSVRKAAFDKWMNHLSLAKINKNQKPLLMFISGVAGTGKSHLIKCLADGVTISYLSKRLMEITGKKVPFGGINVCVFGDLLQLAPVNAQQVFQPMSSRTVQEVFSGIGGNYTIWDQFEYIELSENMRQKEDLEFSDVMCRMRTQNLTENDHKLLKERLIPGDGSLRTAATYYIELLKTDPLVMALLPTNDEVNEFNTIVLDEMKLQTVIVEAVETDLKSFETVRRQSEVIRRPYQQKKYAYDQEGDLVSNKKHIQQHDDTITKKYGCTSGSETRNHGGLPKTLCIAVGARVMLIRNIDVHSGLVNGARGILKSIQRDADGVPNGLSILFDGTANERLITKQTVVYDGPRKTNISRTQFPVSISFAASVHKAQGLTLNNVLISMKRMFATGQAYVAFSRCKNIKGIHLLDYDPSKVICSRESVLEYNRLRERIGMELYEVPTVHKKKRKSEVERVAEFKKTPQSVGSILVVPAQKGAYPKTYTIPTEECPTNNEMFLELKNTGNDCWLIAVVNMLNSIRNFKNHLQAEEFLEPCFIEILEILHRNIDNVRKVRSLMSPSFHDGHQDVADAVNELLAWDDTVQWQTLLTVTRQKYRNCLCRSQLIASQSYSFLEHAQHITGHINTEGFMEKILSSYDSRGTCSGCNIEMVDVHEYTVPTSSECFIILAPANFGNIYDLFDDGIVVEMGGFKWKLKSTIEYVNTKLRESKEESLQSLAEAAKYGHWICHVRISNQWYTIDDHKVTVKGKIDTRNLKSFMFEKARPTDSANQITPPEEKRRK